MLAPQSRSWAVLPDLCEAQQSGVVFFFWLLLVSEDIAGGAGGDVHDEVRRPESCGHLHGLNWVLIDQFTSEIFILEMFLPQESQYFKVNKQQNSLWS